MAVLLMMDRLPRQRGLLGPGRVRPLRAGRAMPVAGRRAGLPTLYNIGFIPVQYISVFPPFPP